MEESVKDLAELFSTAKLFAYGTNLLSIIIIVVLAGIAVKLGRNFIKKSLNLHLMKIDPGRSATMASVLVSIWKYAIYFIAGIMILNSLGINIMPILASAGVVGLAVAFGAQNLVKDAITGFFIIFDNYYTIGDYIQTGSLKGKVTEFGLRSTKIIDYGGEIHIIPNGNIGTVTNYSRGILTEYMSFPVPFDTDLAAAEAAGRRACQRVYAEYSSSNKLPDEPVYLGVGAIEGSLINLQFCFSALLNDTFGIKRRFLQLIREELAVENIQAPAPAPYAVIRQGERANG